MPRKYTKTRLSPAPLLSYARSLLVRDGIDPNHIQVAKLIDVHVKTIYWWEQGMNELPIPAADRHAVHLGLHPCLLWPEWWDLPINEAEAARKRAPRQPALVS